MYTRHQEHVLLKLDTENAENYGSAQLLLNRTLRINGYENKEYHCRGKLDDDPSDPLDPLLKSKSLQGIYRYECSW